MRKLLRQIKRELKTAKHHAIWNSAASCPTAGFSANQNSRFAKAHRFRLRFCRDRLCAIFDKAPDERSEE
jgi:hypothetical protein